MGLLVHLPIRPKARPALRLLIATGMTSLFLASLAAVPSPAGNFTGHYELADPKADQSFSMDLEQKGTKAEFSFSAAMADGSGAAPDGDGKGEINPAGVLVFTFSDSFGNEGKGTLQAAKDGYALKMDPTKVLEPRCLRYYGDLLLRKTAKKSE